MATTPEVASAPVLEAPAASGGPQAVASGVLALLLLPAGAFHPRRGWYPGGASRRFPGYLRPAPDADDVLCRAGDLPGGVPRDLPRHPLAVRAGAQGHPGERAAGRVTGLLRRAV